MFRLNRWEIRGRFTTLRLYRWVYPVWLMARWSGKVKDGGRWKCKKLNIFVRQTPIDYKEMGREREGNKGEHRRDGGPPSPSCLPRRDTQVPPIRKEAGAPPASGPRTHDCLEPGRQRLRRAVTHRTSSVTLTVPARGLLLGNTQPAISPRCATSHSLSPATAGGTSRWLTPRAHRDSRANCSLRCGRRSHAGAGRSRGAALPRKPCNGTEAALWANQGLPCRSLASLAPSLFCWLHAGES